MNSNQVFLPKLPQTSTLKYNSSKEFSILDKNIKYIILSTKDLILGMMIQIGRKFGLSIFAPYWGSVNISKEPMFCGTVLTVLNR
jgi:hypothetical protein